MRIDDGQFLTASVLGAKKTSPLFCWRRLSIGGANLPTLRNYSAEFRVLKWAVLRLKGRMWHAQVAS